MSKTGNLPIFVPSFPSKHDSRDDAILKDILHGRNPPSQE